MKTPIKEYTKQLETRVKELEQGECRFHCRTAKQNWIAGWMWGYEFAFSTSVSRRNDLAKEAYDEWKRLNP